MAPILIRLASTSDLPAYFEHLVRHRAESGREGDLIFSPYSCEERWTQSVESLRSEKEERWTRPLTAVGWERVWILDGGEQVFGELKLSHAVGLKSSLHRAILSMGIERSHRGQGLGSRLMTEALDWAAAQPTLDWVQLKVFAHNEPARDLYKKFGFEEIGIHRDLFRVNGLQIDDVEMSLELRRWRER